MCLSPNYLESEYCRWEWEEYHRRQVHHLVGLDTVATVYIADVSSTSDATQAHWLDELLRTTYTDLRSCFDEGTATLHGEKEAKRIAVLGQRIWQRLQRARRAARSVGNLRRRNPFFVGRRHELRRLHDLVSTGAIGIVTALHGLGGQGKTELAVSYAHAWADSYQAGAWVIQAEGQRRLLPLIGHLAYEPELGIEPTAAEQRSPELLGRAVLTALRKRALDLGAKDPESGTAALLLLDNVSDPKLLSATELASLPREDWLRVAVTTRLGPELFGGGGREVGILTDRLSERARRAGADPRASASPLHRQQRASVRVCRRRGGRAGDCQLLGRVHTGD